VPYRDKGNIGRWKVAQQDLRCRGNTWFIPYRTIRDRTSQRPHPSTFPVKLPEMCIKLHGAERVRRVLDPFVGLGSTAIAAQRLGLPCVGFDLDQYYLDIARRQLTAWVDEDLEAAQLPLGVAEDTCNWSACPPGSAACRWQDASPWILRWGANLILVWPMALKDHLVWHVLSAHNDLVDAVNELFRIEAARNHELAGIVWARTRLAPRLALSARRHERRVEPEWS